MENDNRVSSFQLEVGQFNGENTPSLNACVEINAESAKNALNMLNELSGGEVNTEFSFVLVWNVTEGTEEGLKAWFDKVLSDESYEGKFLKGPRRDICRGELQYKSTSKAGKVVLSFTPPEQILGMAKQQLAMIQEGLNKLAGEQMNKVSMHANLGRTFNEVLDLMTGGTTLVMAVTQLMKAGVQVSLNPNMTEELANAVRQMLEPMGVPIDLFVQLSKLFGNVDAALQFSSTEELPENVRKLMGREVDAMKGSVPKEMYDEMSELMNNCNAQALNMHMVVPDLVHVHAELQGQGFSDFAKSFVFGQ